MKLGTEVKFSIKLFLEKEYLFLFHITGRQNIFFLSLCSLVTLFAQ